MSSLFALTKRTIKAFMADNCMHLAAGVAYYALFSVFPLLLGLVAIFGLVLEPSQVQARLLEIVSAYMPLSSDLVAANIETVVKARGVMGVVAVLGFLVSAKAVFAAIRRSLNQAWGVEQPRHFLRQNLVEMAMIAGVGLLLVLSLASTVFLRLMESLSANLPLMEPLMAYLPWRWLLALLPLVVTFGIFASIYRFLPNTRVTWGDVWPGALLGAVAFEVAKNIFVWYVQNLGSYSLVYGSLAGVIVLLLWMYISAIILLAGAELAAEYTKMRRVRPLKE